MSAEGRADGVLGVIPARLAAARLPRKPLLPLAGRPLIEWVWRRAAATEVLDALVVATDSTEVVEAVERFGGRAVLTRADHSSGTDRVAEVAERPEFRDYRWIVNLQGDEPFIPAMAVEGALRLIRSGWDVGTAAAAITDPREWRDASVVKVVRDEAGGALYFSRAPIPHVRNGGLPVGEAPIALKHVGVYAFQRDALKRATELAVSPLERLEALEQLRWLAGGFQIGVAVVEGVGPGIDTEEDLKRAEEILKREKEPI